MDDLKRPRAEQFRGRVALREEIAEELREGGWVEEGVAAHHGPAGFDQVGCVYTAQGFEYDWNGVIIGPDLVWRGHDWAVDRSANKDPDFRSRARVSDLEFGRLVRNVYKVLLTRGMVGTVIYSPDRQTRQLLRTLMPGPRGTATGRAVSKLAFPSYQVSA